MGDPTHGHEPPDVADPRRATGGRDAAPAPLPPIVEIGEQRQGSTPTPTDTIGSFASFRPTYNLLGMGEYQLASKTSLDSNGREENTPIHR